MRKLLLVLLPVLVLSSCSTTPKSASGDGSDYFASLSEDQAESELKEVLADIDELDGELRGAEARRDQARSKQGQDESKEIAAEGAEAELESLRARKGVLINRQVQLEKRLRAFQSNKY